MLMALGEGRTLLADQAQQTLENCRSSEEQCSELVGSGPDPLCKNHAGGKRRLQGAAPWLYFVLAGKLAESTSPLLRPVQLMLGDRH